MKSFFYKYTDKIVDFTPYFTLVAKFIFNSKKVVKPTYSFANK